MIQPTTFAELNGEETERIMMLSAIFRQSRIPYQIVRDMHDWQICHLAMVVPFADAYYETNNPKKINVFRLIPITFSRTGLSVIFQSDFGRMFCINIQ